MAQGLTLDAGAFIASEKRDRKVNGVFVKAMARHERLTVSAAVLAQVWRSNSVAVARLLPWCIVEDLDEEQAKRIGLLLARAGVSDVVDAAVVEGAARRGDAIVTSDPDDIARLVDAAGLKLRIIAV